MSARIPKVGSLFNTEDGYALVVEEGTEPIDAMIALVAEVYGGDDFSRDNPAIVAATEGERVERWHSCTKAWKEAENIEDFDSYTDWWASGGDGKRFVWVFCPGKSVYCIGEEAEELEPHDD